MVKKIVEKTIRDNGLINRGEHIVMGLSGGPDSVCLFYVLKELSEEMGFTLHAVHVNHGFRPGEAERDQEYAERICSENGIDCRVFSFDCNAIAEELGITGEEAGRKVRYESFVKVAKELQASAAAEAGQQAASTMAASTEAGQQAASVKIAVAQNADDQAETILFRLLRGTGTDGLAGMAYERMEKGFPVVRPLLDCWRKDIEAWLEGRGIEACIDGTNLQPVYTRNKIRLELIPYLEDRFNPNVMEALGRLGAVAAEDKEYLWTVAEAEYGRLKKADGALDQKGLSELAPAIRHRVVLKALREAGLTRDVANVHLAALDSVLEAEGPARIIEFPEGYVASVRYGEVAFVKGRPGDNQECSAETQGMRLIVTVEDIGYTIGSPAGRELPEGGRTGNQEGPKAPAGQNSPAGPPEKAAFDYDKICISHLDAKVELRTRREGDFLGLKAGRKKLQDFFVDAKVPRECRDRVLVAAIGSEILWIPQQLPLGVKKSRYNEGYKLDRETKKLLSLEINCDI